ncbi:MAG: hypothetical protein JXP37_05395, partial [Coriobacteriia bacterium]|nr:hypothetical protein [Coriobacteriia bacterium]
NSLATRSMEQRNALEKALVVKDANGQTALVIPPELSKKYNVLAPAAVLTQADPYFKPSFTIVQLDPDPKAGDFYAMTGANKGKLAMSKDAILKIANAGGIDFSGDLGGAETGEPVMVYLFGTKVMEARRFSYTAIGRFRKSDGTLAAMRAEKEWIPQREALEIEAETSGKDYLDTDAKRLAYAKKEMLRNMEFRSMMCKAKAQNAVMRSAYGIKQKFTPAEAAKPFFVVAYNFTAGDDPNALSIVASLVVGTDVPNLYGTDAPALPDAPMQVQDITDDGTPVVVDVETGEYEPEPEDAGTPEVMDDEPDMFAGVDLSPVEEPEYLDQATAAQYRFTQGDFEGMTVGTLYHSAKGREFIMRVQRGFGRLRDEGTISPPQAEALRAIESYFHAVEGGV